MPTLSDNLGHLLEQCHRLTRWDWHHREGLADITTEVATAIAAVASDGNAGARHMLEQIRTSPLPSVLREVVDDAGANLRLEAARRQIPLLAANVAVRCQAALVVISRGRVLEEVVG